MHLSYLSNLFFADRTKEHLRNINIMLIIFKELGLIDVQEKLLQNNNK